MTEREILKWLRERQRILDRDSFEPNGFREAATLIRRLLVELRAARLKRRKSK